MTDEKLILHVMIFHFCWISKLSILRKSLEIPEWIAEFHYENHKDKKCQNISESEGNENCQVKN